MYARKHGKPWYHDAEKMNDLGTALACAGFWLAVLFAWLIGG